MTIIVTDCGHQYRTGYHPDQLAGCTTDCKVCDAYLYFPPKALVRAATVVRGRLFHRYMHEQDPRWPVDGKGTGYVSF